MRSSGLLVLLALLTLSALMPAASRKAKPGQCPTPLSGKCKENIDLCTKDDDCPKTEKCCRWKCIRECPSTSGVELGKELALSFLEPNRYRRVLCQEKASSIGKSTLSNHCPTSLSAGFIRSLPNSRAMLASQKSTMGSRLVLVCLLFFWAGLSYANKNEKRDFCILPSETGVCKMYIPRFFFNPTTKKCEKFIYGGCGGNKNNFETEKECLRACSGPL
nr:PREDICTED: uncharacterized protein LOC100562249 [Anolis carolinensis]|eukprot:XP_003226822.3 PREDICTED: uncharacterized protein LOC100562249 [Anolis carolinensis]